MMDAKQIVIITVHRGAVQGVTADGADVAVGVVDLDTEGSDRKLTSIPQGDGATKEALCHIESVSVEPARVRRIAEILGMPIPPDFATQAAALADIFDAAKDQESVTGELDDLVTDAFTALSVDINNGGRAKQLRFLLEQGHAQDDLLARIIPPVPAPRVKA